MQLHSKFAKSANTVWPPKNVFIKISAVFQNPRILCWFQIHWRTQKIFRKKVLGKIFVILSLSDFDFFLCFLPITFFSTFFVNTNQSIWNQHKTPRFWYCIIKFVREKLLVYVGTFCQFLMHMLKKDNNFKHFAK